MHNICQYIITILLPHNPILKLHSTHTSCILTENTDFIWNLLHWLKWVVQVENCISILVIYYKVVWLIIDHNKVRLWVIVSLCIGCANCISQAAYDLIELSDWITKPSIPVSWFIHFIAFNVSKSRTCYGCHCVYAFASNNWQKNQWELPLKWQIPPFFNRRYAHTYIVHVCAQTLDQTDCKIAIV